MNRYAVRYSQDALDQLAELWLEAWAEREAVSAAAHRIDTLLAKEPAAWGTPEHEGLWGIDVPPLRALFTIDEDHGVVEVVGVRKPGPPLPGAQANGEVHRPDNDG